MACLQLGTSHVVFLAGPCIVCQGSAAKGPDLQRIALAAAKTGGNPNGQALGTRQVGIFLPHEWMSDKEAGLADFWEGQDLSDPKLGLQDLLPHCDPWGWGGISKVRPFEVISTRSVLSSAAAGSPLNPNGYSGVIWSITADGENMQNSFCQAPVSMIAAGLARQTRVTDPTMTTSEKGRATVGSHCGTSPTSHLLTTIPGVVGNTFAYDCLHILEEGVASHILANCMFDVVVTGLT